MLGLDPNSLDNNFMFVDDGDYDYSPRQLSTRTSFIVDVPQPEFW